MNTNVDLNFIKDRIEVLGYDPKEIMCHKDFEIKQLHYHKDKNNFDIKNKGDYFKSSSYTVFIDQMLTYVGLRKGQGELKSFALNAVAKSEIGDEKLDYSEDANIKTLPYVNFKRFLAYNVKDVLLQMGIEQKTNDVEGVYDRALLNATSYHKIFRLTVFLKNRAYLEYMSQGLIIGNNSNLDYGNQVVKNKEKEDEEDEKFSGAVVL